LVEISVEGSKFGLLKLLSSSLRNSVALGVASWSLC